MSADETLSEAERRRLLEAVRALAREAGAEILKYYRGRYDVRRKPDSSPVTAADEAAEGLILAGLARLAPDIPAIAEEAFAGGARAAVAGTRFWLVDPLDGTKEFIADRDEFTVNIALIENRRPVLGVVYAPARDLIWTAAGPGTAARQQDDRAPETIAARAMPAAGAVAVASRSHGDPAEMQALAAKVPIREIVISGSSIKFCMVAAGEADLYPRYGPTHEWDTAAGHAVLRAAGGSVRTVDGRELEYGKPQFLNGAFIARGRDG